MGFQFTGETDPTRFSRSEISEDDLKDRVTRLLKNVPGRANIAGVFSAGRRPREVLLRVVDSHVIRVRLSSCRVDLVSFVQINPENCQSRPLLPEDVPLAHTNSSVALTSFCLAFCFDLTV